MELDFVIREFFSGRATQYMCETCKDNGILTNIDKSEQELKSCIDAIREEQSSQPEPKDSYSLYEISQDVHEPMSYAEWLGIEDYGHQIIK